VCCQRDAKHPPSPDFARGRAGNLLQQANWM
jgi:hypothetical protein